jgi:hypothetical protein
MHHAAQREALGIPSPHPRKSEVPRICRPFAITLITAVVTVLTVVGPMVWMWLGKRPQWLDMSGTFILGAVIGSLGIPAMIRLNRASGLMYKAMGWRSAFRIETLLGPEHWHSLERCYATLRSSEASSLRSTSHGRGFAAKKDVVVILALIMLGVCVGTVPGLLWHGESHFAATAGLIGCMITLGNLPTYIWYRDLPE